MKISQSILIASLFMSSFGFAQKADVIITNGKITTLDSKNPEAQAVAISGNKIIKAGSNSDILKLKNNNTKLIDAKGNRVVPGLFDSHIHVIRGKILQYRTSLGRC